MSKVIKRVISVFLIAVMMMSFSGCGGSSENAGNSGESDTIRVVATTFPAYDLARNVIGEDLLNEGRVSLTVLIDNGVDLHSYQPTAKDIVNIKECDILIYVGGESDEWIRDALAEDSNSDMMVLSMMDAIGSNAKEEEQIEGMTVTEEDHSDHEDADEVEYDEHVWLSLRNAKTIVEAIEDALASKDPSDSAVFEKNVSSLCAEMDGLDAEYVEAVKSAKNTTMVFGDRFPFRYLVDDYGLDYYAAFNGCSAESEASFETITFLAGKVDELGLKYVITTGSRGDNIAEAVISNTTGKDQEILVLDDMQSATTAEGLSYMDRMRNNLETLKIALS